MFAGSKRLELLEEMERETFDLLVIGGGITGAGIALDAQSRGLRTALVEMQDFAAGTSSRSTKLVHGGLRYLKQLELRMVAEVGRERAIVYENGPHVTTPVWMLLPLYKGGMLGPWSTSLGLRLYDALAGVNASERRRMLGADETRGREPLLRADGLLGGGLYVEYRTDDARLTVEVLKKAAALGAKAVNYAAAVELLYAGGRRGPHSGGERGAAGSGRADDAGGAPGSAGAAGGAGAASGTGVAGAPAPPSPAAGEAATARVIGARVVDRLSGRSFQLRAARVVNAAGPWVDELRELDGSKHGRTLHHTKGVHLVFDGGRFPLRQAVYADTPDGRMIFAIPRDGKTYVGTTDTDYRGDLAAPRLTAADRRYLLSAVHALFPALGLSEADVESSWTGLRPLIHQPGKSPSSISRRDEIFVSASGLISIAGGKLTGYRRMAETVVDRVAALLRAEGRAAAAPCCTRTLPISGGSVGGSAGLALFVEAKVAAGVQLGLPAGEAALLARRYGSNVDAVLALLAAFRDEAAACGVPAALLAELAYAMEHEMAVTPADFFIRRTGALFFDIAYVRRWKEAAVDFFARRCGWSTELRMLRAAELDQCLREAVTPLDEEKA
ncbi:glycerol-3-phosphate dehydrogenase/oxidase [Paenibacillus athensensis]|uniref:Glycerol-3-phosphate dehydrogenase n=1 Tax=Paenibacillus athensensis TaxID=1967502 RepID=A0A4Y8Q9M4_9BACL|nr:glycerol-3-phosphate dehydrogenase/oxidase [Paenibacillus athensensis]MCD1260089.1 glycerol-3-phosphate dehydrogenase/oxidase [Paenibacillus athensensis]